MSFPLLDRCPGLERRLQPLPLVDAPTPLGRLGRLERQTGHPALQVKRDDRTSPVYGGNKPRKLAFVLADVLRRGCRWVVTAGAIGSNHAVATALFGRRAGLRIAVVMVPQPVTPWVRANLLSHATLETDLHPVDRGTRVPAEMIRVWATKTLQGRRPYLLVPGGSSILGTLGFVNAGLELAGQLESERAAVPAALFVPLGTAGTAAGLALGLALAGLDTEVVAVRVVPRAQSPDGLPWVLAAAVAAFLARHGRAEVLRAVPRLRLRVENRFLGPGYGIGTPAAQDAIERFGSLEAIRLEETYTGKAAAAFLEAAAGRDRRPLLLWVTNSAVPPPPTDDTAAAIASLPPALRLYAR